MLCEGYNEDNCPSLGGADREIYLQKPDLWIKASDFPVILSDQNAAEAIVFYQRYKRMGLPFGGGWAEQPEKLCRIIDLLTPLDNIYHPQL